MSREKWNVIKRSKFFYVKTYRRASKALLLSLLINILLSLMAFYVYTHRPQRDFYATNGITEPVKLTPMLSRNYGSEALLPPDPDTDDYNSKAIPK